MNYIAMTVHMGKAECENFSKNLGKTKQKPNKQTHTPSVSLEKSIQTKTHTKEMQVRFLIAPFVQLKPMSHALVFPLVPD